MHICNLFSRIFNVIIETKYQCYIISMLLRDNLLHFALKFCNILLHLFFMFSINHICNFFFTVFQSPLDKKDIWQSNHVLSLSENQVMYRLIVSAYSSKKKCINHRRDKQITAFISRNNIFYTLSLK